MGDLSEVLSPSDVSTHSRLKAAEVGTGQAEDNVRVSTHSRLKAAERVIYIIFDGCVFQHTAA